MGWEGLGNHCVPIRISTPLLRKKKNDQSHLPHLPSELQLKFENKMRQKKSYLNFAVLNLTSISIGNLIAHSKYLFLLKNKDLGLEINP